MPNIGSWHPQVVHFVIALAFVGVALRLVSLTGRLAFTKPSASVLILLATAASVVAVRSGEDAHGPAERIPGVREIVEHHEETGKRTRNLFLVVGALEVVGLGLWRHRHGGKVFIASGIVGLAVLWSLYETAEHGGEIVYEYAGGVGMRGGNPDDIENLLVAGLYHQAQRDRQAGRSHDAARLIDELVRRRGDDATVLLLGVESSIEDRRDGEGALAALARIAVPADQPRLEVRHGLLTAQALELVGMPDSARAVLQQLRDQFPEDRTIQERLQKPGG